MSDFTNFAVYHIYPLGFCGCPKTNDYSENTENRLKKIEDAIPHIKEMGFNAISVSYTHLTLPTKLEV